MSFCESTVFLGDVILQLIIKPILNSRSFELESVPDLSSLDLLEQLSNPFFKHFLSLSLQMHLGIEAESHGNDEQHCYKGSQPGQSLLTNNSLRGVFLLELLFLLDLFLFVNIFLVNLIIQNLVIALAMLHFDISIEI